MSDNNMRGTSESSPGVRINARTSVLEEVLIASGRTDAGHGEGDDLGKGRIKNMTLTEALLSEELAEINDVAHSLVQFLDDRGPMPMWMLLDEYIKKTFTPPEVVGDALYHALDSTPPMIVKHADGSVSVPPLTEG